MEEAFKAQCPSIAMIYKWYEQFNQGRKNLNDLPRVGRQLTKEIRDHIERFIDQFPSSSCRYIAFMLNISRDTVKSVLTNELHLKKFHFRWVPHTLSEEQKMNRIEEANKLWSILIYLSPNQLLKVITCDESWFFLWYQEDGIWKHDGERPTSTKHSNYDPKIIIFTSFSMAGPVLIDALPQNTNFTASYFSTNILPQLKQNIQSMSGISKSIKVSLHMDNAPSHNAKMTTKKIESLKCYAFLNLVTHLM